MAHEHSHVHHEHAGERALWLALALTASFLVVEVVAGILTRSLALISDAAHMFTDSAALAIALAAVRIGRRAADTKRTFGYYRFEILAAAFNALLLFAVSIYIVVEVYLRISNPPRIHTIGMLAVAAIGLCVNLAAMRLLHAGKDSSLNVRGAYLEVWSDMLGSAAVLVGALVIGWTGWGWIDSLVAVAIALWVLPRTWTLLKQALNILLEGVPEGVVLENIRHAIAGVPGVDSLHDLHVWSITSGKVSLTVHVVSCVAEEHNFELVERLRTMLAERFGIHHSTIQLERAGCEQAGEHHSYGPASQ